MHIDTTIEIIDYPGITAYQIMTFLGGIPLGIINIIVICHIADYVTKNYRGSIATNIPLILNGINLLRNFLFSKTRDSRENNFHTVGSIICVVITIISMIKQSPTAPEV